jgi:hypothetical protein
MLGAIGVFVIDRNFIKASIFSVARAALTFFGFMHGEKIGFGESPSWRSATSASRRCCSPARAPARRPGADGVARNARRAGTAAGG